MQTFELLFLMLSAAAELRRWQCHATYIPASIHNEAMLSGAWTSIAQ